MATQPAPEHHVRKPDESEDIRSFGQQRQQTTPANDASDAEIVADGERQEQQPRRKEQHCQEAISIVGGECQHQPDEKREPQQRIGGRRRKHNRQRSQQDAVCYQADSASNQQPGGRSGKSLRDERQEEQQQDQERADNCRRQRQPRKDATERTAQPHTQVGDGRHKDAYQRIGRHHGDAADAEGGDVKEVSGPEREAKTDEKQRQQQRQINRQPPAAHKTSQRQFSGSYGDRLA